MIVTRLRNICADEGLKADTKSLTLLTEIAEGDLRSCLNTLQVCLHPSAQDEKKRKLRRAARI